MRRLLAVAAIAIVGSCTPARAAGLPRGDPLQRLRAEESAQAAPRDSSRRAGIIWAALGSGAMLLVAITAIQTNRPLRLARVVPVAGEDPVLDRPAVEREPHVRAAVVAGVYSVAVEEKRERVPVEVDDQPAGGAELLQRGRPDEGGHAATLRRGETARLGPAAEVGLVPSP